MNLIRANNHDLDALLVFYEDVITRSPGMDQFARWKIRKHPKADVIRRYIDEGCMYLLKRDEKIIAAMSVTPYQGDDYHAVKWSKQVDDHEVAVIHILAVSPDHQGEGLGAEMVRAAIRLSQELGSKAIRLDAIATNLPAQKIYERIGFVFRGKQKLYADNTGWTEFYFYEYNSSCLIAD